MNRPFDRIHDVRHGYGRLLIPWFGWWVAVFEPYLWIEFGRNAEQVPRRFGIAKDFHNCRATGTV
jgi:hypothetical protein